MSTDTPRAALFEDLLERGKKRRDVSHTDSLPALQLSLGDVSSKIRGLGGSKPDFDSSRQDARARYLLAASGVPQGATLRDLESLPRPQGPGGASSQSFDPDMETYMNNLHAKTTMDLLNESIEQSQRDFDTFIEDNLQINRPEQRRRVYEHFGLVRPTEDDASLAATTGPAERGPFGRSSKNVRFLDSTRSNGAAASSFGRSSFGKASMSRSMLGGSVSRSSVVSQTSLFPDVASKSVGTEQATALSDSFLRSKQTKFIDRVNELNRARIEDFRYPLAHSFAKVEAESAESLPHIKAAYSALIQIVGEPAELQRPSDNGSLKPRQFSKEYLDDTPGSAGSVSIRRRILEESRHHLEQSFFAELEQKVEENAREADIGGVPTKINKVRGFVKIKANRRNIGAESSVLQKLGDDYIWVLLYYLLRSGLIAEAAQFVADNEPAINAMDRHFAGYIKLYAQHDRNIPFKERMNMNRTYQQRTLQPENSVDPYRMALYKIMGRCDLTRKSLDGIDYSIEDLIWLFFALARETNRAEETAGEVFNLDDVQAVIENIGERHFAQDAGQSYATYFWMLTLTGMFEKAVEWLYRFNYVAATHFAIVLDYYGLLRVADFSLAVEDLLTYTTREKAQISFGRMMGYYTREFRQSKPEAAADYLILLCLNSDLPGESGRSHSQMCHDALKDLVLETREFALLVGDMRQDGFRVPGVIEQRLALIIKPEEDSGDFLRDLTLQAAATADDSGRITDAVLLYHLSEDFESVIAIVNRALSDALSVSLEEEQSQLQPLKPRAGPQEMQVDSELSLSLTAITDPGELAGRMMNIYRNNAMALRKIRTETIDAASLLLAIAAVKKHIMERKWAAALDEIRTLTFLPFEAKGNINTIRLAAQRLNSLSPVVARNIGPLLIWAITACGEQRSMLQNSLFETTRNSLVEQLATSARDLMVYAGLIRYKLPAETFEQLARSGRRLGL